MKPRDTREWIYVFFVAAFWFIVAMGFGLQFLGLR